MVTMNVTNGKKMITPHNPYTQMQQKKYDHLAILDRDRNHNGNILQIYDAYYESRLWRFIPDILSKDVLDFGCGPGRNLIFYTGKVKSIHGVDIADRNLDTARQWILNNGFDINRYQLFKNDGVSLNGIPDSSYDIVMSTICLQHISVHEIRYGLLEEFNRVLRPNGYVTLQFLYSTQKANTVHYHQNAYGAQGTNGDADCVVGDVNYVIEDLTKTGFTNIQYHIDQAYTSDGQPPKDVDDREWLFITGQKQ